MKNVYLSGELMSRSRFATSLALLCFLATGPRLALPQETAVVSGQIVDPDGQPVSGLCFELYELSFSECCFMGAHFGSCTQGDGSFSCDVSPAEYVFSAVPPYEYDVVQMRIDASKGNQTDLILQLTSDGDSFVPDDPPRAGLIQISQPDGSNMVTVSGLSGSVPEDSFVILVSLDTGHFV